MAEEQLAEMKARLEVVSSQLDELRAGTDQRLKYLEAQLTTGGTQSQAGIAPSAADQGSQQQRQGQRQRRSRILCLGEETVQLKTGGDESQAGIAPSAAHQGGGGVLVTAAEEPAALAKNSDIGGDPRECAVQEPAAVAAKSPDIDDPREYVFEESTWDAVFVCGSLTTAGETFVIAFGCLLNAFIQLLYCWIVYNTLAKDSSLSEQALKELAVWRIVVGHHAQHYDPRTETSLVSRVCADSGFSIRGAAQQSLYNELNTYQSDKGGDFMASPSMMCILSIFFWLVVALNDFMRTVDCARALLSLPRALKTRFVEVDGAVQLEALSMARVLVVSIGVVLVKFAIVITIGFLGVRYLVITKSAADLLLNAIALQFILEVDELLYTRFVPMRVQGILSTLKPLPINDRLRAPKVMRRGFPFRAATVLAVAFVLAAVIIFTMLAPEIGRIDEGARLLCGGERDFFYTADKSTGAVTVSHDLTPTNLESIFKDYTFRAVLQRTGLEPKETLQDVSVSASLWDDLFLNATPSEVFGLYWLTDLEAVDRLDCTDLVTGSPSDKKVYTEAFKLKVASAANCFEADCRRQEVRPFCPVTCGCVSPGYGLFNRLGCSHKCDQFFTSNFDGFVRDLQQEEKRGIGHCRDLEDHEENVTRYFAEVQKELMRDGRLVQNHSRGEGFIQVPGLPFEVNASFDLGKWAVDTYKHAVSEGNDVKCNIVPSFLQFFSMDLCHTELVPLLGGRVGSIKGICIRTCGYCTERPSTPYKDIGLPALYNWSSALPNNTLREFLWGMLEYLDSF